MKGRVVLYVIAVSSLLAVCVASAAPADKRGSATIRRSANGQAELGGYRVAAFAPIQTNGTLDTGVFRCKQHILQAPSDALAAELLDVECRAFDAQQAGDRAFLSALIADTARFQVNGKVYNKEGYLKLLKPNDLVLDLEFQGSTASGSGTTAVLTSTVAYVSQSRSSGSSARMHFTERFTQVGGEWQLIESEVRMVKNAASGGQELTGQLKDQAEKQLEAVLLNRQLIAKVTFPAWKDGIDLKTDRTFDMKWVTRQIKDHGVGIDVGDKASVTNVKLKDKVNEIHLNGGGAGTLGDVLMTSDEKKARREAGTGKAPGGSRINLQFDRRITQDDIRDLDRLIEYLEPVVDASSLRQAAKRQSIPDEFKEAASKGSVGMGMDKATVFAIMGEQKNKAADMNADPPIEKWQFDLPNLKTRIVTFKEGRVIKVDEF